MSLKIILYSVIVFFLVVISNITLNDVFAYKAGNKWNANTVNMYINPSCGPSGSYDAIKKAAQTWTDVSTASFVFYIAETSYDGSYGKKDDMNFVCFGSLSSKSTVARTKSWSSKINGTRYITENDIIFNTKYFQFSTDGSADKYDVQNVAAHELGHVLLLYDLSSSSDTEKTMYGKTPAGETKKRDLDQDDIDGISYLYP